jgi:hypothetical protein
MALLEHLAGAELLGVNVMTGLAVGAAALFVAPLAVPILRPIAKAAIKGGLYAYQSAVELYEQASGAMSELATEAQQELQATAPIPRSPQDGPVTAPPG